MNDKTVSAHSVMEIHLHNLLYCHTFDSVAKDNSCSGGFCNIILEERGQEFWTAFTLSPAHVDSQPCTAHTDMMST